MRQDHCAQCFALAGDLAIVKGVAQSPVAPIHRNTSTRRCVSTTQRMGKPVNTRVSRTVSPGSSTRVSSGRDRDCSAQALSTLSQWVDLKPSHRRAASVNQHQQRQGGCHGHTAPSPQGASQPPDKPERLSKWRPKRPEPATAAAKNSNAGKNNRVCAPGPTGSTRHTQPLRVMGTPCAAVALPSPHRQHKAQHRKQGNGWHSANAIAPLGGDPSATSAANGGLHGCDSPKLGSSPFHLFQTAARYRSHYRQPATAGPATRCLWVWRRSRTQTPARFHREHIHDTPENHAAGKAHNGCQGPQMADVAPEGLPVRCDRYAQVVASIVVARTD